MTNFERIKNMTVEEMAEFIAYYLGCNNCIYDQSICPDDKNACLKGTQKWLESEAEE